MVKLGEGDTDEKGKGKKGSVEGRESGRRHRGGRKRQGGRRGRLRSVGGRDTEEQGK